MNSEENEKKKLIAIRINGWVIVLAFIILLMTSKNNSELHQLATYLTAGLCVLGTVVLYGFWDKFFHYHSKEDAESYIKPYRLGSIIIIFGALYIVGVKYFGV